MLVLDFLGLSEDKSFAVLEQESPLQDREYSNSSVSEASLPAENNSHKAQSFPTGTPAHLLLNYNHGFPQTGLNLHKWLTANLKLNKSC